MLERYAKLIDDDERYRCPSVNHSWTRETVLAMSFLKGEPIDALEHASQETRNSMMTSLFALFFREVFEFKFIQTDPNLANYLVDLTDNTWILLDFGATRPIPSTLSQGYLALINGAYCGNTKAMLDAACAIGIANKDANERQLSICLLYTSPSPRDQRGSRMPSSA